MTVPRSLVVASLLAAIPSLPVPAAGSVLDGRITVKSVRPDAAEPAGPVVTRYGLTREDAARIKSTVPTIDWVVAVREQPVTASVREREADITVSGTSADYMRLGTVEIERGRFLTAEDDRGRATVAVVTTGLADRLFPSSDPVGKSVKLSDVYFVVVGVLKTGTAAEPADAWIPLSTMRGRFGDLVVNRKAGAFEAEQYELSRLEAVVRDRTQLQRTKRTVEGLLAATHDEKDVTVTIAADVPGGVAATPGTPVKRNRGRPRQDFILEAGTLESAVSVTLANAIPGESTVLRVVPEGTRVTKGDVVVELDGAALRERADESRLLVLDAERQVMAAKLEISAVTDSHGPATRAAQLRLELAMLELDHFLAEDGEHALAVKRLKKKIEILEETIAFARTASEVAENSGDVVAAAKARLQERQAQAERESVQTELRLSTGQGKTIRTRQLQLDVELAKSEIAELLAAQKREMSELRQELARREDERNAASRKYTELDKRLRQSKLVAPVDGIVVYSVPTARRSSESVVLEPGATVRERQSLVQITDMQQLQVRVRVHESRIQRIKPGQECQVTFDALPNRTLSGAVKSVSDVPVPGAWPNVSIKEYEAVVVLPESNLPLRLGLTCEVRFLVNP